MYTGPRRVEEVRDGTGLADGYVKGFLCTLPRQKATKSPYYYRHGEEVTYESTEKHKEWSSVPYPQLSRLERPAIFHMIHVISME